jgi:hypothetical protein
MLPSTSVVAPVYHSARERFIVTMDDDLQHPPEEIPRLLSMLADGDDVVYGTPQAEQHGFLRDLASRATKIALQSAMGADIARQVSEYRVFRTSTSIASRDASSRCTPDAARSCSPAMTPCCSRGCSSMMDRSSTRRTY